ncbi:MAG: caspase family protein [Cyclobacteriaceae bacterium]
MMKTFYLPIFLLYFTIGLRSLTQAQSTEAPSFTIDIPPDVTEPTIKIKPVNGKTEMMVLVQDNGGIDTVWVNDQPFPAHRQHEFEKLVAIASTTCAVRAVDSRGNVAQQAYLVRSIPMEESIAVPPPGLAETKMISSARYHALIIGVENYKDQAFDALTYPIDDAEKLQTVLGNHYRFGEITLLKDPTKQAIESALNSLRDRIGENDNLLIFFAGHGHWNKDARTGFWIPSDAIEGDHSTYVRTGTVREFVSEIPSQHTLLIVDACYSGSIFKLRGVDDDILPKDVMTLYGRKSRKAMTSATLAKVPDNSVFMKYLLQQLQNNRTKYLPAGNLFYDFRNIVNKNSHHSNTTPLYEVVPDTGDESGEFIFTRDLPMGEVSR